MNKRQRTILALTIALLLFIALYGWMLRGIWQERTAQAQLREQIVVLETAVSVPANAPNTLATRQAELLAARNQQATVVAELEAARRAFPSEVESTSVLAHIITTAAAHDANLRQVEARESLTVTLDVGTYQLLAYDVEAEGELDALSDFLQALEQGPVNTLSLENVELTAQPSPTPRPTRATGGEETAVVAPYRISLVVEIYVRQRDSRPNGDTAASLQDSEVIQEQLAQARQMGDWERVISLLLALRQAQPDNNRLDAQLIEAYVNEGQRRLTAGQYSQAQTDFEAALALAPENQGALQGMAAIAALTPTATPPPTATPTATPPPTETPMPSPTPVPTLTPTPVPYFPASIRFSANTRYLDLGCEWFGITGRVRDASGAPIPGLTVRIWTLNWEGLQTVTNATGEYELFLDDHPRAVEWQLQLLAADTAVSDVATVQSTADCDSTLITVDWQRRY